MEDMKWDMGGAATVAGTMLTLARRKAQADVIGVCGLVENMPDGNAQRPGDVVKSMNGQTIEVINTTPKAAWCCAMR
jgi:leucyl aminopeptidase